MTIGDISTKITQLTGASTDEYTNAQRLIDINLWQQKIIGMIFDSQDESDYDDPRHGDYPRLTTPMTTNRDYSIPVTEAVLKIRDVSVSYDGTNWYRATPIDFAGTGITDAPASATTQNTTTDAQFSKTAPRYDIKFGSLFLYPKPVQADVDAGGSIMIEWFREPKNFTSSDLTTGTEIPGFDNTFHPMLAYGPAYEWCSARSLPQTERIYRELADYEMRLRKQYSSKQLDRQYQLSSYPIRYK